MGVQSPLAHPFGRPTPMTPVPPMMMDIESAHAMPQRGSAPKGQSSIGGTLLFFLGIGAAVALAGFIGITFFGPEKPLHRGPVQPEPKPPTLVVPGAEPAPAETAAAPPAVAPPSAEPSPAPPTRAPAHPARKPARSGSRGAGTGATARGAR
jgi:hypothetical protein